MCSDSTVFLLWVLCWPLSSFQDQRSRSNYLHVKSFPKAYCIQENIWPHFIFAPFALVSRQIEDWVNSNFSYYLSFNTTVSGENSRLGKTVFKCRKEKITWERITLYTVFCLPLAYISLIRCLWEKSLEWLWTNFQHSVCLIKRRENANQLFYFTLKQTFCSTVLCSLMSLWLAIRYLYNMFMLRSISFLKLKSTLILVHMYLIL